MNAAEPARPKQLRSPWIDMGRILATIMIVYYHLPSSPFSSSGLVGDWAYLLFENPCASLAFFFLFAGYFVKSRITLQRAAIKSLALLLPYLFWNLICLPGLNDTPNWQRIFGWGYAGPPCDYPLWFVRDLILLTLLSPFLQRGLPFLIVLCTVFTAWGNQWHNTWLQMVPLPVPGNILLYLAGLALSRFQIETLHAGFRKSIPVLLLLLAAYYAGRQTGLFPLHAAWTTLAIPFLLIAAILLVSEAFLQFLPRTAARITPWAPACFLVYAAHAPALILAGKLTEQLAPWALGNNFVVTIVPVVVIACCLPVYRVIQHFSPGLLLPLTCHEGGGLLTSLTRRPAKVQ